MKRMSIPEPNVEHHEGRGIRSCPIFPELRPILYEAFEIFGDKSEYVVAAPQYRAITNMRVHFVIRHYPFRDDWSRAKHCQNGAWHPVRREMRIRTAAFVAESVSLAFRTLHAFE